MKKTNLLVFILFLFSLCVPQNGLAILYTVMDLGTLGGGYSYSESINETGQVFGFSRTSEGAIEEFVWDENTGMNIYDGDPRYDRRYNSGYLAGTSFNINGYLNATINNQWLDIPEGYQSSVGEGVNNLGHVVGHASKVGDPHPHNAVVWYSINDYMILGSLGGIQSRAHGINDNGIIVGESSVLPSSGYSHGFIWDANNGMQDLNDLVLPGHNFDFIGSAYDINNLGFIAAQGRANNEWHAILLKPQPAPIPEPGTILLLAFGLIGLVGFRKKFM